ncbi:MAG TPA: TonB-dependent receptor [Xanthobacteraceae bacterium]|nr:TonB-dependent receptor [Xanthobacteraceae bacterium]
MPRNHDEKADASESPQTFVRNRAPSSPCPPPSLYAGYQVTPEVLAAFSVDNLLNVNYTKYECCSTQAGDVVPNPGLTFKGSLTFHEGLKAAPRRTADAK